MTQVSLPNQRHIEADASIESGFFSCHGQLCSSNLESTTFLAVERERERFLISTRNKQPFGNRAASHEVAGTIFA